MSKFGKLATSLRFPLGFLGFLARYKKDKNDRSDIEQLCFLEKVDAIVTDDKGIMKNAFDLLYKERCKKKFNLEEFINFLKLK